MPIQFGGGTLTVLENLLLTGGAVTTGTSGTPASNLQVSSGLIMIDGITAVLSAASAQFNSGAGLFTGSGLLLYAHLSGNTTTGIIAIASAADPINTATNIPTAICPLARFSFGTGSAGVGEIVAFSGGSATKTIDRVQNVSITISSEQAQMRGGADQFPVDTKQFDSVCEGNFEFSEQTSTHFQFFGGIFASGGAVGSGTWTLSGNSRPNALSLVFQNVTDGNTSTYRIMRAYLSQQTNDFTRTDFMNPAWTFVTQVNVNGDVLTIQG